MFALIQADDADSIIVDLFGLTFIDSTGIRLLYLAPPDRTQNLTAWRYCVEAPQSACPADHRLRRPPAVRRLTTAGLTASA
jgi:hypothetical protein